MMELLSWLVLSFTVVCGCTFVAVMLMLNAPSIKASDEEADLMNRINYEIAASRQDWERLEARAERIVELHGYQEGSYAADEMAEVVLSRQDYWETRERIAQNYRFMNDFDKQRDGYDG